MDKNFLSKNIKETKKIGEKIARLLKKKKCNPSFFALKGCLGSGKTTFVQGFAEELGVREKILSPTFVIIKKFKIHKKPYNFKHFFHIDCYRIKNPKELLNLGFIEIIKNPKNIVAVEWAERIKKIVPKNGVWINFKIKNKKEREIKIKNLPRTWKKKPS